LLPSNHLTPYFGFQWISLPPSPSFNSIFQYSVNIVVSIPIISLEISILTEHRYLLPIIYLNISRLTEHRCFIPERLPQDFNIHWTSLPPSGSFNSAFEFTINMIASFLIFDLKFHYSINIVASFSIIELHISVLNQHSCLIPDHLISHFSAPWILLPPFDHLALLLSSQWTYLPPFRSSNSIFAQAFNIVPSFLII
jgi:hypothetical protein